MDRSNAEQKQDGERGVQGVTIYEKTPYRANPRMWHALDTIPNRVMDCSQPGCMEMVGIMQSVPVIRLPQTITIAGFIGLFEAIGTISPQLIRTMYG